MDGGLKPERNVTGTDPVATNKRPENWGSSSSSGARMIVKFVDASLIGLF